MVFVGQVSDIWNILITGNEQDSPKDESHRVMEIKMKHEQMIASLERIIHDINPLDLIPYSERKLRAHLLLANLYADNGAYYPSFMNQVRALAMHDEMFQVYDTFLRSFAKDTNSIDLGSIKELKDKLTSYSKTSRKIISKWPEENPYIGAKHDLNAGFLETETIVKKKYDIVINQMAIRYNMRGFWNARKDDQ